MLGMTKKSRMDFAAKGAATLLQQYCLERECYECVFYQGKCNAGMSCGLACMVSPNEWRWKK